MWLSARSDRAPGQPTGLLMSVRAIIRPAWSMLINDLDRHIGLATCRNAFGKHLFASSVARTSPASSCPLNKRACSRVITPSPSSSILSALRLLSRAFLARTLSRATSLSLFFFFNSDLVKEVLKRFRRSFGRRGVVFGRFWKRPAPDGCPSRRKSRPAGRSGPPGGWVRAVLRPWAGITPCSAGRRRRRRRCRGSGR